MNISKNKLKEIIQEELNVLIGIEAPSMICDPVLETTDFSSKNINYELLTSAEKAAIASSVAAENLNKAVAMLEHIERGGDLSSVQTKVIDALDNISKAVDELNVFHKK